MNPCSAKDFYKRLDSDLREAEFQGLHKVERVICSRQGPRVLCVDGITRINLCANNYLGLAGSDELVAVANRAQLERGFGLSSVRFICGTQDIHKRLERDIAAFVGTEDAALYAAAFDANGGTFETLFGEEDAIISDALNHASIIDGIRLCKARRLRYDHNDMANLELQLRQASQSRTRLIVTDGVFSMDGTIAQLGRICALAKQYDALVMVDDCHATGFLGATGRGTAELHDVFGQVDIITGTFGKALGGAMGGFVAAKRELVETLRQRSRPYLFSNSLAPSIVATTSHVLNMLSNSTELRDQLAKNARAFRSGLSGLGLDLKPGQHPIIPIMLYDAPQAQKFAHRLYELGVLVTAFSYPVVPIGQARVRVQISAAHTTQMLEQCIDAFRAAADDVGIKR